MVESQEWAIPKKHSDSGQTNEYRMTEGNVRGVAEHTYDKLESCKRTNFDGKHPKKAMVYPPYAAASAIV